MACTDSRTAGAAVLLLAAVLALAAPAAPRAQGPAGIAAVLSGLAMSMETAGTAFREGRRRDGTRALNDARRAAMFGHDNATGPAVAVAADGLAAVRRGRHALQNGDPERAAAILLSGAEALRGAVAALPPVPPRPPADLDGIAGRNVIDADGTRLGEIDHIAEGADGTRYAVLRVGGVTDFAGFIDWGNREAAVPLDRLVIGRTMAALTESVSVPELLKHTPADAPALAER
ncbi:PRC-barrel domain-containing protein [Azospirillum sp. ST 5-10]|uniref:PRC-barrel domain-containing protein n=1 Tax=unclassified Azospirillum TaxID=2630922 RepID=UPI003F49DDCF